MKRRAKPDAADAAPGKKQTARTNRLRRQNNRDDLPRSRQVFAEVFAPNLPPADSHLMRKRKKNRRRAGLHPAIRDA